MSLDTKYRPVRYDDVLGQEATKTILRQFVAQGKGFEQSYLFAGPFGSGKTTLGRILARALLCDSPQEGDPCDQCPTCKHILSGGAAETFVEVDAATNSGKAEIKRIIDEIQYDTFSGKQRIYLFDESHQLSKDALDALLKPLEENIPGSRDKRLVCIFCTTEPEKMRATILSRCAPAFVIRPLDPGTIAKRLVTICEAEGIGYEEDALRVIAEMTECHIRDAIKAVEGVRMLGKVDQANTSAYLNLDINDLYLTILEKLPSDLAGAVEAATKVADLASPGTSYQRLADAAMMAYRVHLGAGKPESYWDQERVARLAERGDALLNIASRLASRPGRPSLSMLLCDLATLHHLGGAQASANAVFVVQQAAAPAGAAVEVPTGEVPSAVVQQARGTVEVQTSVPSQEASPPAGKLPPETELVDGTFVRQKAVRKVESGGKPSPSSSAELPEPIFCELLGRELSEDGDFRGPPRRPDMDRP